MGVNAIQKKKIWSDVNITRDYAAVMAFAVLVIYNVIFTKNFVSIDTFWSLITQGFSILMTGFGMALVIASGGIDISVGSTVALSGITIVNLLNYGEIPAMIGAILVAVVVGLLNGIFVTKLKVQPFIVTLVVYMAGRGVAQLISAGISKSFYNKPILSYIGIYRIKGIPIQFFILLFFFVVFWLLIKHTTFGIKIQTIGDNPIASKYAGINSDRIILASYVISAMLAGFASIFEVSRVGAASPSTLGNMLEMDAIAAVVIGGTPMTGGKINLIGMIFGALTLQLITVTVHMQSINYTYAYIIKGVVTLLAFIIQLKSTKK